VFGTPDVLSGLSGAQWREMINSQSAAYPLTKAALDEDAGLALAFAEQLEAPLGPSLQPATFP